MFVILYVHSISKEGRSKATICIYFLDSFPYDLNVDDLDRFSLANLLQISSTFLRLCMSQCPMILFFLSFSYCSFILNQQYLLDNLNWSFSDICNGVLDYKPVGPAMPKSCLLNFTSFKSLGVLLWTYFYRFLEND